MSSLLHRCAAEMLGVFVLVMIGPGAIMVAALTNAFGHSAIALAFGVAVAVIVATCGPVSGAHINPAVTVGLWSAGRFPSSDVLPYILAQCAGAVAASFSCGWLFGPIAGFGATIPVLAIPQSFALEMGWSGLLGFVIVAVATAEEAPRGVAPLAIGATVFAGALVAGPLTGGSFNPARSLGPAVASGIWSAHWLYWVAPIAGMVVAMRIHGVIGESRADVLPENGATA